MKRFYITVTVMQDRNESIFTGRLSEEYNPGFYAYVISCTSSDNLQYRLNTIGGLQSANIFPTRKEAKAVAECWNDAYKANGRYLFDEPKF